MLLSVADLSGYASYIAVQLEHRASAAIYNKRREFGRQADDIAGIAKPGIAVAN